MSTAAASQDSTPEEADGKCQFVLDTRKTARGSLEENKNGERETEDSTGMEEFFFVDE